MSDLSFKGFALAKGFVLPVRASSVAKSLGMNPPPPISMRAMIATAAPFVPSNLSYDPGVYWWDPAALSSFEPPSDPLRAATSFEIKFWKGQPSTGEVLVIDVTLPLSSVILSNGGMFYDPGVLDGIYTFQITAINPFGSASTSAVSWLFTPPAAAPNINVTRSAPASPNLYTITGTGFEAYNGQSVTVQVEAGLPLAVVPTLNKVVMVNNGGFTLPNVSVAGICGIANAGGSGAPLRFYVLKSTTSPGAISNIVTTFSCN